MTDIVGRLKHLRLTCILLQPHKWEAKEKWQAWLPKGTQEDMDSDIQHGRPYLLLVHHERPEHFHSVRGLDRHCWTIAASKVESVRYALSACINDCPMFKHSIHNKARNIFDLRDLSFYALSLRNNWKAIRSRTSSLDVMDRVCTEIRLRNGPSSLPSQSSKVVACTPFPRVYQRAAADVCRSTTMVLWAHIRVVCGRTTRFLVWRSVSRQHKEGTQSY